MSLIAAVIAGASLFDTSVEQISRSIDTWRNVTIEITNYSNTFTLTNPRSYTYSGYCYHPPQPTIAKRTKEACSFSKTPHTACGSVGVLTYQILNNETKHVAELAIMFSVPFDYNQYENMFALGIYEPNISCDKNLYNKMYYHGGLFTRGKGTGGVITYCGNGALVKGTMSAYGQSIIRAELWDK
ncbi:DELTA-stichotoxin-Hcr4a-like [Colossoma macropomum]|uniref:DELTA-stichotoxin-Hcr4a-like n=1 Tax=Colossoma macropomum TaxID=42526 RepID=UPI00186509C6|nr:DELTA-stichotoxin-Hcr4a-like [Colossoma macropomum]